MPRLTVKEAAEYIPCGMSTLNNYRTTGGGPVYIKMGGKILYDTKDLDAWIEAKKRKSTSVAVTTEPPRRRVKQSARPDHAVG